MPKYRRPYRIKKKKPIFKKPFFWLFILFLIMAVGIFYLICFSFFFQIKEIKISGNQKVLTENLKNTIEDQMARNLFFLKTKSIFLTNLNKINKVLLKKFPHINKINLEKKFPHTLKIKVKERKPVAIFFKNKKYFFLDKEGVIFEKVSEKEEYLKIKTSNQNQSLNLGDRVMQKELLISILKINTKLKDDFKIPLKEVLIIGKENIQVKTSKHWEIYFNLKGDISWQLTKLRAVLSKEIPLKKRKDLDYIDLRFGNFAPYKYR